ncbi:MAG: 2-amino-4-hydroxy-6-hydroxymethyldihydropteridine diphosphokinase [Aureispira sp.]|nr:2-amino-4-hydroxy-6-hydroxymethyldihydropteridine diphosphokinase [Aureispira sp.]
MNTKNICFLSTGSNLGNRYQNLDQARLALANSVGSLVAESAVYETAAWGVEDQTPFLNQVLQIETDFNPQELLLRCQAIELSLGRIRTQHWGERMIDIDILFFNDAIIEEPNLTVPHPYLHQRRFVLVPMQEIAPNWLHKPMNKTINTLLKDCEDQLAIRLWTQFQQINQKD